MSASRTELIDSLEESVSFLDSCLRDNEVIMNRLEAYQSQAESFAKFDNMRTSTLRPFGPERVGRPPIPLNEDTLKRREFAKKFLEPMSLKPDWSPGETQTLTESLKRFSNQEYDWSNVVDMCLSLDPDFRRSAISCKIEYLHAISARPWTRSEDDELSRLVSQTKGTDWIGIGRTLGRTGHDCFSRCYLKLHPVLVPSDFTRENDEKLRKIVQSCSSISWTQVVSEMDTGHTEEQCRTRWSKTLSPGIRSGRWNPQLDQKLLAAVAIYGPGKWMQIAAHIGGKTDRKCRERWSEKFAPNLKPIAEWEPSEDALLLRLVKDEYFSWSAICKQLPGRTDQQCRLRFLRIAPENLASEYREILSKKIEKKLEKKL